MNERELDEFLNDPGHLFVRQCEQLWQEMWTISNDGGHSMALRSIAEAILLYLELPGIYDKASATEQDGIHSILMTTWTAGAPSVDENVLVALSLKVCANMAWQLPKPADMRQPTLQ